MILVFGTICLDHFLRIPRMPPPGGYVEVEEELELLGGEAANTAAALKAWNADVRLAGNPLGTDDDGARLRKLLAQAGLRSEGDKEEPYRTPICDILLTPDGERTMIGRGFSVLDGRVDLSVLPFEAGSWFTAEPNMSQTSRQAAREAHNAGMRLYLMDFFREDEWVPEGSVCQLSTDWVGERGNTVVNLRWAEHWSKRHRCATIVTDGAHGSSVATHDRAAHYPAFLLSTASVDSTGAGDLFRAGMLFGMCQGRTVLESLPFASAAGAFACLSVGGSAHVPSIADIQALINSQRLKAL